MTWNEIAPTPTSGPSPKGFNATNPAAYAAAGWAVYDAIVGMRPPTTSPSISRSTDRRRCGPPVRAPRRGRPATSGPTGSLRPSSSATSSRPSAPATTAPTSRPARPARCRGSASGRSGTSRTTATTSVPREPARISRHRTARVFTAASWMPLGVRFRRPVTRTRTDRILFGELTPPAKTPGACSRT